MSRFSSYLASAITPQMTLLEKFNALLKFCEELSDDVEKLTLYRHTIYVNTPNGVKSFSFISTKPDKYKISEIASSGFAIGKLEMKSGYNSIVSVVYQGNGNSFYVLGTNGTLSSFVIAYTDTIQQETVTKFSEL